MLNLTAFTFSLVKELPEIQDYVPHRISGKIYSKIDDLWVTVASDQALLSRFELLELIEESE